MTDKEASVFIIDLGQSMSLRRNGRKQSDLEYSLLYFYDKITNNIATGRKTLLVGVIGLSTEETNNALQDGEGYDNITTLQPIQQVLLPDLHNLIPKLIARKTNQGDALSAVILGIHMITQHCRNLKYVKNLYLLTNGLGAIDTEDLEATAAQIKQTNIRLTVLGVDFDDAEYGFKEEDKAFGKAANESALKKLVDMSDGVFGTMEEAIAALARPHIKLVKPIPSYKGQLRLGGVEYDTAITIDIERYPKVMVKRPPTASSFAVKEGPFVETEDQNDSMTQVQAAYSYQIEDEETATGYREVPREDLAKGYEYGRTAVHVSEIDESITKLETQQSYDILGFIPSENVERYLMMGTTHMIVPAKINDKAAIALSSMIHALYELASVAVARYVQKDMKEPMLVMLSPSILEDVECLIENDLPFAEDLRVYRFPPVDKLYTVAGKQLTEHRNLPTKNLLDAMSDYVDHMSLADSSTNTERLTIEDNFSPLYHTIDNAIKSRALHPDQHIPEKPGIVLEPSLVPSDLQARSKTSLVRLVQAADVKKVPPKVKGRARWRDKETDKPISGLNIDALLSKSSTDSESGGPPKKIVKIDPLNAIPEFKRLMQFVDDLQLIKMGLSQMNGIAETLIKQSVGEANYERVVEILSVVRDEMVEMEMPDLYNDLIRGLKKKLIDEALGGDRKEFWWRVRVRRLGLIDQLESDVSPVTEDQAMRFMRWSESSV